MFLHPEDQSSWNYITERLPNGQIADGQIIVSTKIDSAFPKDIIFTGQPTMDMIPLDDEAKVMITALEKKWKHPINDFVGSFADQLPTIWAQQLEVAKAKTEAPSVSTRELEDLRNKNDALSDQLAELKAIVEAIAHAPQPQPSLRRSL